MIFVKALELVVSYTAGHCGNVIDVWLRNHSSHCGINIPRLELTAAMRFPKCDEVEHNQSSFCESLISVHHYLGGRFKANTGSPNARLPSPKLQLRETALRSRTWPRGRHTMLCAGAAYSDLADRSNGTVRPPEGKPFVIQLGCL